MSDVKQLIMEHLRLRPMAHARDVYKLLYQGVFGVGHIVSEKALGYLLEESGRIDLKAHAGDPLLEPVNPDGSMVRVNLRQYIKAGGELERLYTVMIESAKHEGDPVVFMSYWDQFKEMVSEGLVEVTLGEVFELDLLIQGEGLKPRHHTEFYRQAYYPAYRVVQTELFKDMTGFSGYC